MANITLPTSGTQNMSTTTFGPVAAAMVLSTPIVLICSVGGIMIHHKLSAAKAKKPIFDLSDESWMIQDSAPAKKNTVNQRTGRSMPPKKRTSPQATGPSTEIAKTVAEVEDVEEKKVEVEETMKNMPEKTKQQKDKARRKAKNAEVKAEERSKIEEEEVEYTKGLLRNKIVGVTPPQNKEDIKLAITEIFQERMLEELLYKEDWKVVEKKERKSKKVVEMKEMIEKKMMVEKEGKKALEAELDMEEEKEEEESSEAVSHTTEALTPPEL